MNTSKNTRQTDTIKQSVACPGQRLSACEGHPLLAGEKQPPSDKPEDNQINRVTTSGAHDNTANYTVVPAESPGKNSFDYAGVLNEAQQQLVLKFCRQLVSVIEACEQSESTENEAGHRQINSHPIKAKPQAERKITHL